MKAIVIVFEHDVTPVSRFYGGSDELQLVEALESTARTFTDAHGSIRVTTLSELEVSRGVTIGGEKSKLIKKEATPLFVSVTRFLDDMRAEFGDTEVSFIVLEIMRRKGRPDIAKGLGLCKSFANVININKQREGFRAYMNHLSTPECDNLINFIILLSKI